LKRGQEHFMNSRNYGSMLRKSSCKDIAINE
jgi:hypothetical protein